MAEFAVVVRHVKFWRGNPHRWSTVYPFVGTAALSGTTAVDTVKAIDDDICYGKATTDGGIYKCDLYDLTAKGTPLESHTYFDWENPTAWIAYSAAGWDTTGSREVEPVAEVAMNVQWYGGMSRGGKPVYFTKWYHSVPVSEASDGVADMRSGDTTLLNVLIDALPSCLSGHGLTMGNSRRIATTSFINDYYGNHQMPKGRKRKKVAA